MDIKKSIKEVFDIEIRALKNTIDFIDDTIIDVVNLINDCKGKVVVCGMGKPGHIARKISATMSSLGISSYVLHPAEALHGDLGILTKEDILLLISNSGETAELCNILPNVKMMEIPIVSITSNATSTLAQYSEYVILLPIFKEACVLNLAPTSSTTAALVLGDAIAVTVSQLRRFKKENFALYHPAGALGRKLTTTVEDIMHKDEYNPIVAVGTNMENAIIKMCEYGLGAINIVDSENRLLGLITDGDLKRYLGKKTDIYSIKVEELMTKKPVIIKKELLAIKALALMENRDKQFSVLPIIDDSGKALGLLRNHDIIKLGIF